MADPSEFAQLAAMGPPGSEQPIPELENLQRALAGMKEFQSKLVVENQESGLIPKLPPGIEKATLDGKTGKWNYQGVDPKLIERLVSTSKKYDEIMGSFHQESERLKAQEQQAAAQPPWVQLATALSANLAQAKDMPGWVQAAGRTAAQLNPRPEEIRAQRLGVLAEEAKLAEAGARMGESSMRTGMEQKRLDVDIAKEERLSKENRIRDLLSLERDASSSARAGGFDPESYYHQRVSLGDDPKQAEASTRRLGALNEASVLKEELKQDALNRKDTETARRLDEQERHNRVAEGQMARRLEQTDEKIGKALEKKTNIPEKTKGTIRELLMARESGKDLLKLFDPNTTDPDVKKVQELMGPIKGRFTEAQKRFGNLTADEAKAVNKVSLQFVNAVGTIGTGTYGYRISERGFVQSFTEAMKNEPGQNFGNLSRWMEWYDQQLSVLAKQYDIEDIEKYAPPPPGTGVQGPTAKVKVSADELKNLGFK